MPSLVSSTLPVYLERLRDGSWHAEWDMDSIIARSDSSIADDRDKYDVVWLGNVGVASVVDTPGAAADASWTHEATTGPLVAQQACFSEELCPWKRRGHRCAEKQEHEYVRECYYAT